MNKARVERFMELTEEPYNQYCLKLVGRTRPDGSPLDFDPLGYTEYHKFCEVAVWPTLRQEFGN